MFQKSYAVWEVLAIQNVFYFPGKQWSKLLWNCSVEFSHTYQSPSSTLPDDISNNNITLPVVISVIIEYVSSAISLLLYFKFLASSRPVVLSWVHTLVGYELLQKYICSGPSPDSLNLFIWYSWYHLAII